VTCQGTLNDCSSMVPSACNTLQCNPLIGVCANVPVPYNTPCTGDGTNLCQVNGICAGGACLFKRKCGALDNTTADPTCNTNECDPTTGNCVPTPRTAGSSCILPNGVRCVV
jgi:hypothetical protein